MSIEANEAAVRRYFDEIVNKGTLSVADEIVAPTYCQHHPLPGVSPGPGGVKWAWCSWRAAFPDWRASVDDLVAEGDAVTVRITARGTHRGELVRPGVARVPPTGKAVEIAAIVQFCFQNGRIAAITETADFTALFEELGIRRVAALEGTPA